VKDYTALIIWAVVVVGVFAFLWAKGYLVRIRSYIAETREELRKCTWPTRDELKGSTVVVVVTMFILGMFTVAVDFIMSQVMRFITS
jgi:preprotein translocase subunit SecE